MSEERADKLLQKSFPEYSRSKIQSLIERKKISYQENNQWKTLNKPGIKFSVETWSQLRWRFETDSETQFVSRAGFKLEEALSFFSLDVSNRICLDVGLSTGGFSHCLLNRGVEKILGIDVGHSQLHERLCEDQRLVSLDKINAREPLPSDELKRHFGDEQFQFSLIVIDVSFISLDKITANIVKYLETGGYFLALVKPQFEVGRGQLSKKGVVKDAALVVEVVEKNIELFRDNGLKNLGQFTSPIEGENGNKEVFVLAKKA